MSIVAKRPTVVLACKVFKSLFERFVQEGTIQSFSYLEYGLHDFPKKLKSAVQEALDGLPEPSLVILGYGLCGNGLDGIRAGKHSLLISRADDCIAIFLGSHERYVKEFTAVPGTYYLTEGWLESGSNPLQEYKKYVERYGAVKAGRLIDQLYHNYERLALVAHSAEDLDVFRARAQDIGRFCERWGMRYEEILGSTDYFERLIEAASNAEEPSEDFIYVAPGGELRQDQFRR
jgi:uncharacterized protein DUF1638